MSLGARAAKGGAKGGAGGGKDAAAGARHAQDKKTDKPQPKEKVKPQATTEQLRMAHMIDRKNEDASDVRRMVLELMEMTRRTEEEVCSALHDSDNDMAAACNLLLEDTQRIQGEWQTSEKKKKKPQPATGNGEASPPRERERSPRERDPRDPRSRSGPRRREDAGRARGRGGAPRGRGGAPRGGRGGRRAPPPRAALRAARQEPSWDDPTDTGGNLDAFPPTEDWDNEEWSGSLSDTKVFTPSASAQIASGDAEPGTQVNASEEWDSPETNGPLEAHIPSFTYHNPQHARAEPPAAQPQHQYKLMEQLGAANSHPLGGAAAGPGAPASDPPPLDNYHSTPHHQPMGMSGSLSAAQSQYLSQLTQQSQRHDNSVYSASYGVYGASDMTAQRKPQRARVPPPSKIPSSAVEMPGGGESGGAMFLDVQFGALEPDALQDAPQPKQVTSQPEVQPAAPAHETTTETPNSSYSNTNSMLSESLSVVDTTPTSQPVTSESIVTNSTTLEKQLTASMKQLGVSAAAGAAGVAGAGVAGAGGAGGGEPGAAPPAQHHAPHQPQHAYTQHHRPKTVGQQNVYAHHAVSHHPPVYGANVYAPQVNSTNASLTGASAMTATAYPSSVTLTQYQPMINSYQQTSSSATVYGGSALYTAAAPYTAYQPTPQGKQGKEQQYDATATANSLSSTPAAAKVATTTVSATGSTGGASASSGSGGGAAAAGGAGGAGYAAGALYGAAAGAGAAYAAYDEAQMMRSTLPHHIGGYYEVGYGVSGGREGTFGLGAGERFGRTDAASPQQVPAAALPPGYAYYFQPPPTTYQYGVYPTYGGGSNVGGVGGVGGVSGGAAGKLSTYAPQQPPYDAQDSYKPGGPYTGNASKTAGGAAADLTNAMYAKTHVALNKVNSYEKAAFHSGTPPPFGAGSHLYIPAPPHHHHSQPHHHAPQQHQMDVRVNSSHNRRESGAGGGRSAASKPPASKPTYSQSYWAPN